MNTPFFPALRHSLTPRSSPTLPFVHQVRSYTLCQLESCLGRWVPETLFPKATGKQNSRDRDYTRWRTFWCMLWQALNPAAPGREVVRQLQALFRLHNGPTLSAEDGAYCRAKARLPLEEFPKALAATAQAADRLVSGPASFQGRPLKAIDGSTLSLPDLPKNRQAYPPLQCPNGPSFPMLRFVVLYAMLSGAIGALASGSLAVSELALFESLSHLLSAGDILLGDRGFGCYPVIALLQQSLAVDFIGRTKRRVDGRQRLKRLGRGDWLIRWKRSATPSPWLHALQWAGLPGEMTLRALKGRCHRQGFRVRQVTVVTTLLDAELYPAEQILQAYLRRWRLEMCLDDLKTTLQLDMLRSHSPEMARRELYVRLIAHNLVRCVAAQAASQGDVALQGISFKGTLDALRHFSLAMSQAHTSKTRRDLWVELLQILVADLVPERPGRREPRAVKRKKNKYPRLVGPRDKFQDHPKRHARRKLARLRRLALM